MSDFQNSIKEWVLLDNKIKNINSELSMLRNKRKNMTENIYAYVETNKLDNAIVEISDGTLKFQQTKSSSPLTFKFVERCLNDCISNEAQVKMIMKYIKNNREFRYNSDIKRSYK